jgi:hypothetical protein
VIKFDLVLPVSTTTDPRVLAPARPLSQLPRGAGDGVARFAPRVQPGTGAHQLDDDVIDVEVLWEDVDEHAPAAAPGAARPGRPPLQPLRLLSAATALAAYRTASTTRHLPHAVVDLFA